MIILPVILPIFVFSPMDIDSSLSSIDGVFEHSLFVPGTIIGNFESKKNPKGTSTLPGVWGGSGNNPIATELTPTLGGPFSSPCEGSLTVVPNFSAGVLLVDDLVLTAFTNADGTFPLEIGMWYETFRTVQPDSLFVGGFQFDIPLGEASVSSMRFEQVLCSYAELIQTGEDTWSFDMFVAVTAQMEVVLFGTPTGPLLIPSVLPLEGTITTNGNEYQLSVSTSWGVEESIDSVPIAFENVPIELPTILPPGNVAHVLLSADVDSVSVAVGSSLQFTATGGVVLLGDVNGDGVIDVKDLYELISFWGPCDGCTQDLNGDGGVDITDVLIVIDYWTR